MSIEKERGITIRTSTVSFNWNNTKINLLDTPGHVDFIAEVERSMQVLDGAILVISAKEGVQVQTRVLFNTLKKLQIPTLIFINKIDRAGVCLSNVYTQIKEQLSLNAIKIQSIVGEETRDIKIKDWTEDNSIFQEVIELMCELDEHLMSKYISEEEILQNELQAALINTISNGIIYPIFHGSALQEIGIRELLRGIETYLPDNSQNYNEDLSALIYKMDRDENFQKKIYIRMFQGKLNIRDVVEVFNKDGVIKIKKLESIKNGKIVEVSTIKAGDIGILSSIEGVKIGDIIGTHSDLLKQVSIAIPTLKTTILPINSADRMQLIKALYILMEEDPFLSFQINPHTEEINVHLFGEVQMEVIKSMIKERFLIDIELTETMTLYKERPKHVGTAAIAMGEHLNPFRASIELSVEPVPIGSGLVYESQISYGYLTKPFQTAVFESVKSALNKGVFQREITDIKVCFTRAYYDSVTSTPSDFRDLAPFVLMEAVLKAETELLEPVMNYELIIPQEVSGRAMADLSQMRATFSESYIKNNEMIIRGRIPVETSKLYPVSLASYTGGRGVFDSKFCGYQVYIGETEMKDKTEWESANKIRYLLQKSND